MPRYDYRCTSCGHEFELNQSFSQAGVGACPECAGEGRRVFHAVPVIYKGSGFYTTDYGRPKPPTEDGAKDDDKKEDGKKGETSSAKSDSTASNGSSGSDSSSKSASETAASS